MKKTNKYGLSRDIPLNVKREVRQRCRFGCVICGEAIIQYHHFNPPFAEATFHDPGGITLLCGKHHDFVNRKMIPSQRIEEANASPKCKVSPAQSYLFLGNHVTSVQIGSSTIDARTIIMYENDIVLGFNEPETEGAPMRLNAIFTDAEGQPILQIRDNEWEIGSDCYDLETTGSRMKIRRKRGETSLEMDLQADKEVTIQKMRMLYKGFMITIDEGRFVFQTPRGGTFSNIGVVFAEIGIWMKQDGSALIAANKQGGAAVAMG